MRSSHRASFFGLLYARSAFTLFETLIACVILSFSVLAVTYAVAAGQMETSDSLEYLRAMSLTEGLMEELVSRPFVAIDSSNPIGPELGEVRATFSSADDFHGFSEAKNNIKTANGTLYPSIYQSFTRAVTVVAASVTPPGSTSAVVGVTVTVTVTSPTGVTYTMQRFVR